MQEFERYGYFNYEDLSVHNVVSAQGPILRSIESEVYEDSVVAAQSISNYPMDPLASMLCGICMRERRCVEYVIDLLLGPQSEIIHLCEKGRSAEPNADRFGFLLWNNCALGMMTSNEYAETTILFVLHR